jgi:hypothetical protein
MRAFGRYAATRRSGTRRLKSGGSGVSWYMSPTGSSSNLGTLASPWSLVYAFAGAGGAIQPGDRVWMLGGTYALAADLNSAAAGSSVGQVVFQSLPGQWAKIDIGPWVFNLWGDYCDYFDFEVYSSDATRVSAEAGSNPTDMYRPFQSVTVRGQHCRTSFVYAHDLGNGFLITAAAGDHEMMDCVASLNGWVGPDRSHGHGAYLQNTVGATKRVRSLVAMDNFYYNLHAYGSEAATIQGFQFQSPMFAHKGGPSGETENVAFYGGGTYAGYSSFTDGRFCGNVTIGLSGSDNIRNVTLTGNVVLGTLQLSEGQGYVVTGNTVGSLVPLTGGTVLLSLRRMTGVAFATVCTSFDGNTYFRPLSGSTQQPFYIVDFGGAGGANHTFTSWKAATAYDATSTLGDVVPATPIVDIVPHEMNTTRFWIRVVNPAGEDAVTLDPSSVLAVGQEYTIRSYYDHLGDRALPVILSGTYAGGTLTLSTAAADHPARTPIGWSGGTPPTTAPEYVIFLLTVGSRVDGAAAFSTPTSIADSLGARIAYDASTERLWRIGGVSGTLQVRYSDDEGATWSSAQSTGITTAIAPYRSFLAVDGALYLLTTDVANDGALRFRKSTDNGVTWSNVLLSANANENGHRAALAVSGTTVHVANSRLFNSVVRQVSYWRSTNGGTSFGSAVVLSSAGGNPDLAVVGTTVHCAYELKPNQSNDTGRQIVYRRSDDDGATWGSESANLFTLPAIRPRLVARGSTVNLVYELIGGLGYDMTTQLRRSTDNGATWASEITITASAGKNIGHPVIGAGPAGYLHVVSMNQSDSNSPGYYVYSADDGATWSTPAAPDASYDIAGVQATPVSVVASATRVHVIAPGLYESTAYLGSSPIPT